ncbi:hypothetical protein N0V83_002954 [Neocucurbitaria cava]|uniref:Uncharacterized protein n=1 Tax=Neocucurbitaria cava TaxID=798079 RepID=A0A9W8YEN8_9PLEO|nr:hypothetical protein N0V83_002954 [Neocucurbitaria cava]
MPTTLVQASQFDYQDPFFNDSDKIWSTEHIEEHPFVQKIREGVLQYRLQSASHFEVQIDVHQTRSSAYAGRSTKLKPSFKIEILFHDFNARRLLRICRLKPQQGSCTIREDVVGNIQVRDDDRYISLYEFLDTHFPTWPQAVKAETLHAWWNENGKTFDWTGLPTELKERIIKFCMHRSLVTRHTYDIRYYPRKREPRRSGPYEVADQLGRWSSLLGVSRQVRAITLRLCFVGHSRIYCQGLSIRAYSRLGLKDIVKRLGACYQLLEPNSLPLDDNARALAATHQKYPKIFPELRQYATLWHGVRRVSLQMDFLEYFHFFKVRVGGFEKFWRLNYVDYEVFEQLPHLNEINIKLPRLSGRLEDKSTQPGPPLFYEDFVCPRVLDQFIYEQAAKILAPYRKVKMYGFIDNTEALRFKALLEDAIQTLKFTSQELRELYMEDGGGIVLEEIVIPGVHISETEDRQTSIQRPVEYQREFWPPKCRCAVRCRKVILGDQDN